MCVSRGVALVSLLVLTSLCARGNTTTNISYTEVNNAMGMALFSDQDLWSDDPATVAKRLKLRLESDTGSQSLYRTKSSTIFGVPSESFALYGRNNTVAGMLIMFANKGDSVMLKPNRNRFSDNKAYLDQVKLYKEQVTNLDKRIRQDGSALEQKLTELFGPGVRGQYGQPGVRRQVAKTWSWAGNSFVLAAQKDESLSLRIVPDESSQPARKRTVLSDSEAKKMLAEHVEHRPNGDVIITGIPMISQGRKGYCVPCTWARYLQYMGIQVDEYALANAGNTSKGGGTTLSKMATAASDLAKTNKKSIRRQETNLSINRVSQYIDKGIPIMWSMSAVGPFVRADRTADRMGDGTVDEWKESLREYKKHATDIQNDRSRSHMCLIIGYNDKTDEIATSDSWGMRHAEKWYTLKEARRVSHNIFYVIKP